MPVSQLIIELLVFQLLHLLANPAPATRNSLGVTVEEALFLELDLDVGIAVPSKLEFSDALVELGLVLLDLGCGDDGKLAHIHAGVGTCRLCSLFVKSAGSHDATCACFVAEDQVGNVPARPARHLMTRDRSRRFRHCVPCSRE